MGVTDVAGLDADDVHGSDLSVRGGSAWAHDSTVDACLHVFCRQ